MPERTPWRLHRTQQGIVLDHVDKISIAGNPFNNPVGEYWVLVCLWEGMEFLYRRARGCDDVAGRQSFSVSNEQKNAGRIRRLDVVGESCSDQVPESLLTCLFHWYAVSAVQYVRTVGAIANEHDSSRQFPREYAGRVIPEVCQFRDEVAARFAWLARNRRDHDAARTAGPFPTLSIENCSYHVGDTRAAHRSHVRPSNAQVIEPWSLCRVHEALRERYWPNQKRDEHSSEQTRST